jgi:prephenate dehydrogenase
MRVALLGFGLIGGSIAHALRRAGTDWSIAAWSPSGAGPRAARAGGFVDAAPSDPADAVRNADLIVLAGPPLACLELLGQLAGPLRGALEPDAVVTDVASTKRAIVGRAAELGLRFVGGHPMAGREVSGFAAASADLFDDRPWVVVPAGPSAGDGSADASPVDPAARDRVIALARACRARPIVMTAADHDIASAGISHLPLLVAAALVEAVVGNDAAGTHPDWAASSTLAASGWEGITRLARGDATMGAGILATNAEPVAERLRRLRDSLDGWLAELEREGGPDPDALRARFEAARRRLEEGR